MSDISKGYEDNQHEYHKNKIDPKYRDINKLLARRRRCYELLRVFDKLTEQGNPPINLDEYRSTNARNKHTKK